MSQQDFENAKDPYNDAARKSYEAAMDDSLSDSGKGLHMYRKTNLWEEENPVEFMHDSPINNFVPTPTINTGDDFATKKTWKKVLIIAGIVVAAVIVVVCAVSFLSSYVYNLQNPPTIPTT